MSFRTTSGALPFTELAPMMRDLERAAMRDKSYRRFPVGQEAGRYLRALRYAGASQETLNSYETVYCRLALRFADFASLEDFVGPVGKEHLREFLDREWGECAEATRRVRLTALSSLARWAVEEGRVSADFTAGIRAPRARSRERQAHPPAELRRLIIAQPLLRDQCALGLLCMLGLRKNELRLLQIGHIDLGREFVTIHGKGDKVALLPIAIPELRDDLYLNIQGEQREPHEFLLYPRGHPEKPMVPSSVHRWFKNCLAVAGLSDRPLHELRHSAGDAIWRATGNLVLAQQLLRHISLETTRRYLHPNHEDLARGLRTVGDVWRGEGK
jgi:integrase